MAVLPTNYLDDILAASMGGKRRFRITHEDGSTEEVTLEDVSEYEQVGSPFGSGDVNKTNQAVNEKLDSADVVDPALATVLGFAADAKLTGDALSELNKNFMQASEYHDITIDSTIGTASNSWYRKVGTDVEMFLDVTIAKAKEQVVFFTLPEGYRTRKMFMQHCFPFNSNSLMNYLSISASGAVAVYVSSANVRLIEHIKFSTL